MSLKYTYTVEVFNTIDSVDNLKVNVILDKFTKILSMTDLYITNNLISETDIVVGPNINTVAIYRDDNGTKVNDLMYLATVNSNTGVQNNFYYHKTDKIIINIPAVNEIDVDSLKGKIIDVNGTFYGNSTYNEEISNNNFLNIGSSLLKNLSLPNTLNTKIISVKNLKVTGLNVTTNINNVRTPSGSNTFALKDLICEFVFINNSDLNLDSKTTLFTIISYGTNSKDVVQLSKFNNPTFIILPLI